MKIRFVLLAGILLITAAAAQDAASVAFSSQSSQGDWVVVDSVALPDGGFVAIHENSPGPANVLGASMYLEPGEYAFVPVELDQLGQATTVFAVLHGDDGDERFDYVSSDGQADGPLFEGGRQVAAPGQIRPGDVASVVFEEQDNDGTLEIAQVYVPSGGFVAIHYEYFLDGDYLTSTAGHSDVLAPGNHTDVTIEVDENARGFLLAVVHQDSDGDGVYDFDIRNGTVDPAYIDGSLPVLERGAVHGQGSDEGGPTTGAERDTPDNDTPAPAIGLLMVILLGVVLRRR